MAASPKRKPQVEDPEITELKQQLGELTDALQRERADATNVRRRAEEDRLKMASYFKASVVKELLPFIDNFDRALKHAPKAKDKTEADWLKGLEGVNKQLWQALEALSVQKIQTVGSVFDPKYHEAVQMDGSGEGSQEIVTEEFMSGYVMDGEVLRHAMVKVAMK
jgi:molecular chaperone GrpE